MVSILPTPAGTGVASLLQQSNSGSSSGMFNAISGNVATDSTSTNLFNAISGNATTSSTSTNSTSSTSNLFGAISGKASSTGTTPTTIDGLLQQQKITTQKNAIYANVATRLDAMRAGTYTASADWEKVASYAMQTGQPVAVSLDDKGQVQALPQSQADLSKYNPQQQKMLTNAMADIATMASKIQANKTNDGLVNKLSGAEYDLSMVATGQLSATSDWEKQGAMLMTEHHPFKISLDPQGNLQVQDQLLDPMTDLSASQQKALHTAVASLPKVISTGYITTAWQADALSFDQNSIPYYLTIDPVSNQISAVENSADNITPDFLKTAPYSSIGDNTPMLKQAASLIQSGKAFFLDFDQGGRVTAKPATAQNLIKFNAPAAQPNTALGTGSILSLFA